MSRSWLIAGLAALLIGGAAAAQEDEGRPRIFLEKKIFAEDKDGKKNFYESHTVRRGENLWKIMSRGAPLASEEAASLLKEFRRANPEIANLDRLLPGQKILVPSAVPRPPLPAVASGRAEEYRIVRGDRLIRIFRSRGVPSRDIPRYLEAVKELNEEVRDVNRIYAGRAIVLPTEQYFEPAPEAPEAPSTALAMGEAAPPPPQEGTEGPDAPADEAERFPGGEPHPVALTKDAAPQAPPEAVPPARPEGQLVAPETPPPPAPATRTGEGPVTKEEPGAPRPKPPYRGLLMDIVAGLGEKWQDRGTMYIPVPAGGEIVLSLEDFPVASFSNGRQVLVDFRGGLPSGAGALITETWPHYRVVSMEGAGDPREMIGRLLAAAGYSDVKDGTARPLVIGEGVSVALPARWIVLRTRESLLSGDVVLIKEVPEKPPEDLAAVLRYADRVGIRVIPFAVDEASLEGFVIGLADGAGADDPAPLTVPAGGIPAVDFALELLGIPGSRNERIRIGDAREGMFRLVMQPERIFEAGGKRYIVDAGKVSPALAALVRESGYSMFPVSGDEPGVGILRRLLKTAGSTFEERRDVLFAGGGTEGYEIRLTGLFLTSPELLERRGVRAAVLIRGKAHAATRALMRSLGVEILGW